MKKKTLKAAAAIFAACMMLGSLAGCGSAENETTTAAAAEIKKSTEAAQTTKAETTQAENLSGTVTLAGSTSMKKLCEAMSEGFMETYTDITVTVEYTGSGAGLESLVQGSIDIGNASRALKDGEKEQGAVENIVAIDGIAVITDKDNSVKDLTAEQLADIYTGNVTNWNEIGGEDEAIVVIGREAGSGTRSAFEELLKIEDACSYAQELDNTGAVLAKVASTPGAIGYVSLDVIDDSVLALSLDGVEASEANIVAGKYLLSRPFVMATMGEISEQNELVRAWFDYVASEEGQSIITDIGLILPQ